MNQKDSAEYERLSRKWACGTATSKQVMRCMALGRKSDAAQKQSNSDPMEQVRAVRGLANHSHVGPDLALTAFMSIFHPEVPLPVVHRMRSK